MSWIRFSPNHIGWQDADGIRDFSATEFAMRNLELTPDPMLALITLWPERSQEIAEALHSAPVIPTEEVLLKAPLVHPSKIVGAPANYLDHAREMNSPRTIAELGMFLKAPSSIIGPNEAIVLPPDGRRTDQEGELAVVIGRRCRDVAAAEAMNYVFGYTCILDISTRGTEDRSTRKSYDTFAPLGPSIVPRDSVENVGDVRIRCWVNDDLRQDESTEALIFDVPRLIEYTSSIMTLLPGDIIATGTPEGVGPLNDGDRIRLEIEQIGTLEISVTSGG